MDLENISFKKSKKKRITLNECSHLREKVGHYAVIKNRAL